MTTDLRQFELDNLRIAADKAAMNGNAGAGAVLRQLVDSAEDAEAGQAERISDLESERDELETERDDLREALTAARGQLERIRSTSETASDPNALECHGEIRLLAEEAIKDIADTLD